MSAKQWIEKTHAKGIIAKAGRYGGTYAYKDIALELLQNIYPHKVFIISFKLSLY